jgi:hypothetical protein
LIHFSRKSYQQLKDFCQILIVAFSSVAREDMASRAQLDFASFGNGSGFFGTSQQPQQHSMYSNSDMHAGSMFQNNVYASGSSSGGKKQWNGGKQKQQRGHPYAGGRGGFGGGKQRQPKSGYFTESYNPHGNNMQAGQGYRFKTGGALTRDGEKSNPSFAKAARPYAKFVIDVNSCVRVCYLNGEPMIRISDCVDIEESRGPKEYVERSVSHPSASRTVYLTVENFANLLRVYPALRVSLYEVEECKKYLGTEITDLTEIHSNLFKVDTNPSISAGRGKLTFQSYYTVAGENQENTWSVVYGRVEISGKNVSVFTELLPQIEAQLMQMPSGDHVIMRVITGVIADSMLNLLKGHAEFNADQITICNPKFMEAYFSCHEELTCAGFAANLIKKISMELEAMEITCPLDLFPTVFQAAYCQQALIKTMQSNVMEKELI